MCTRNAPCDYIHPLPATLRRRWDLAEFDHRTLRGILGVTAAEECCAEQDEIQGPDAGAGVAYLAIR